VCRSHVVEQHGGEALHGKHPIASRLVRVALPSTRTASDRMRASASAPINSSENLHASRRRRKRSPSATQPSPSWARLACSWRRRADAPRRGRCRRGRRR